MPLWGWRGLVVLVAALDRARALITRPRVEWLLGGVSRAILIGLGARLVRARNA